MILVGFFMMAGMLLVSAHLCGDASYFINLDSIFVVLVGVIVSGLVFPAGRVGAIRKGLRQLVAFRCQEEKDPDVRTVFLGVALGTVATGFCSMVQGVYAGVLPGLGSNVSEMLVSASFAFTYSVVVAIFSLLPVVFRNT